MKKILLEVIAHNLVDVVLINKSQADRIELCSELDKGGYTPQLHLIKQAIEISALPIMIMLRHEQDFVMNKKRLKHLLKDIKIIKKLKPQGFVFGAITLNNEIDELILKKILKYTKGFELTFHKAFDKVKNKDNAVDLLLKNNVNRVLTSGGLGDPIKNKDTIKKLLKTDLEILVGGGVKQSNFKQLLKLGIKNIHVGSAVRIDGTYNSNVSISKINKFK